jgi:flagellar capping protein FliD
MSGFDYGNTCPAIDAAIDKAKDEIKSYIDNLLDDACPLFGGWNKDEYVKGETETLYKALEDVFEDTRNTNVDMRRQAEKQIAALESEVEDLQARVAQLERMYE